MTGRSSAGVGDASGLGEPHQHVVGVYDRDDELVAAVVAFLSDGLVPGGSAIVIATPEHRRAVEAALAANGFDVGHLLASGRYASLDARDALGQFMAGDRPDPARFDSSIGAAVAATQRGGGPVRLFGEMVALLWDDGLIAGAIELEALWNDLARRHSFALFCAYAMSSLETSADLAAAKQVCDRHSSVFALPADDSVDPIDEPRDEYSRLFLAVPSELRKVRDFTREVLRAWGDDDGDNEAEVVASELATNSVLHGGSPFKLSLTRDTTILRIAVRDASHEPPRLLTGSGADVVGGRGIRLVAGLSRAWGTDSERDGKTVWAEVVRRPAG